MAYAHASLDRRHRLHNVLPRPQSCRHSTEVQRRTKGETSELLFAFLHCISEVIVLCSNVVLSTPQKAKVRGENYDELLRNEHLKLDVSKGTCSAIPSTTSDVDVRYGLAGLLPWTKDLKMNHFTANCRDILVS